MGDDWNPRVRWGQARNTKLEFHVFGDKFPVVRKTIFTSSRLCRAFFLLCYEFVGTAQLSRGSVKSRGDATTVCAREVNDECTDSRDQLQNRVVKTIPLRLRDRDDGNKCHIKLLMRSRSSISHTGESTLLFQFSNHSHNLCEPRRNASSHYSNVYNSI